MKTAEEIFNKYSWAELGAISPSKKFCIKAMKEYAKEAIKECAEIAANTHHSGRLMAEDARDQVLKLIKELK